jgi:hypothetical protein
MHTVYYNETLDRQLNTRLSLLLGGLEVMFFPSRGTLLFFLMIQQNNGDGFNH